MAHTLRRPLRPARLATFLLLALISVAAIYPLVFMPLSALKGEAEYKANPYGLPASPTLDNFANAWRYGKFGLYFWNSLLVVVSAVVLSWIVCSMAGYALAHLRFRGRRLLFYAIIGSMMIAAQVIIIPLHSLLTQIGLINSRLGLVLVYASFAAPFGTYLMTSYFRGIPRELVEAAEVDGANHLQVLWHVMVPVAKPAIVTLGIFNFLWMWNELLFALLVLKDDGLRTLMVGVANLRGQYTTNIPYLSAGLFLAALPILLVFLIFQAHITKGMTMGAVK
ncbi:MAG: carbohydrate ABC transporter permease [Planctomycetes bacterium]|nr:carbohydrate ABC transporter permease [Planctomycetota bacterium]